MSACTSFSTHGENFITGYAILITIWTVAAIKLGCIIIFKWVYWWLAEYFNKLKLQTITQIELHDRLTQKMHLLQFVNYYASIIYAAFLQGMSAGSPGGYHHHFGFRQEEDYEDGSDALNDATQYASHVGPVRTLLPSKVFRSASSPVVIC
ncbi:anoctamin-7-like isoform X3 [Ischnura elegans]|uniref:anoctamin-7-like isoform X3 n=1 Tax=Ischnura elegans TaxID=197161 RepID=UPI001ED8A6C0|nr:anoctamin-7-like isoform X3 [Ischnura elegans]